jgi:hypothetical protein
LGAVNGCISGSMVGRIKRGQQFEDAYRN